MDPFTGYADPGVFRLGFLHDIIYNATICCNIYKIHVKSCFVCISYVVSFSRKINSFYYTAVQKVIMIILNSIFSILLLGLVICAE